MMTGQLEYTALDAESDALRELDRLRAERGELVALLKDAHRAIGGQYMAGIQSRIRLAIDKAEGRS